MAIEISEEEVNSLTAAIMTRHGIDFTSYEPKSLKRRVVRALSVFKLNSIHELWVKVLHEKGFVHTFVNELSVGLTSMFRDPHFWNALSAMLPNLSKQTGGLKVWHAGCSTGEEVYTFNIVLHKLGLEKMVQSMASDMNTQALDHAKAGLYHHIKMEEYERNFNEFNPNDKLSNYYNKVDKFCQMEGKLIERVEFKKSNLITDTEPEEYDIIFCRNVMIYFDNGAKRIVLDKFYENLKPGALLIIGFFDALLPVIDKERFEIVDLKNKMFRKIK